MAGEPGEEADGVLLVPSGAFGVVAQRSVASEAGDGVEPFHVPGSGHGGLMGLSRTIRQLPSGWRRETIVP
jgi:hypothetical protein